MDADEWLRSVDTEQMLEPLRHATRRKLRLVACACCRAMFDYLNDDQRAAVEAAELYADGYGKRQFRTVNRTHFDRHGAFFDEVSIGNPTPDRTIVAECLTSCTCVMPDDQSDEWDGAADAIFTLNYTTGASRLSCERLLREIFANPFRPVAFDPSWRTSTAVAIAKGMYESRDFAAMPLLADALQDAGCEHPDMLDHCRGPGPHVKGCWVVDFVLGKE